jgi:ABC-2 type transport system ATP-binding protein
VIDLLDLEQLKNKRFSDLSQGQKKRAAIAKVFLHESDLYLLDEPTANLDPSVSKDSGYYPKIEQGQDDLVLFT